ncbi:hypothetical protein E4T44_03805 [Aureobasidium sp. EXF-8845]|nr:hypothetical protein E4T44_03805 [Aureobasidium sp. EXF-8845]KAI4855114.1 hypothetical protein E4T45_03453 [Aureobasidium sp. EXF-8846]
MFYSHEVLTSRKHGVATVWLVATLGSKSTLKKVDRKEICAVNIPKACRTIVSPEAPMALRLQSNLLYGVSRVYGEQCNFVLKDAQVEQNKIRTLLRSLHAAPIELDGKHKVKPIQLLLEDDPNFIPELAWGIDFDPFHDVLGFTSGEGSSPRSSLLSPHAAVSSALGSEHHMDPALDLIIPGSSSVGGGGFGLGLGGTSLGGSDHNRGYSHSLVGANEERLLPDIDLGLDFENDVNLVDNVAAPDGGRAASIHTPAPVMRDGVLPDSDANRDVVMYDDDPLPVYQDDIDMQDVEPFAPRNTVQQADSDAGAPTQEEQPQSQISSTTASAPAVRTRVPKPLPRDQELELHNSDLQTWDREYLDNQSRAVQQKLQNKTIVLARKNANFWVLQNGIGGLGSAYQGVETHMPEPLRIFSGTALLEALTGIQLSLAGTKHPRAIDGDPEEDERRFRTRSNSREVGRAQDSNGSAGFDTGFIDDTIANTIEQGRDAPTSLQDIHSSAHALPWNHAAPPSRGSSHHTAFVPPYPVFGPNAVGPSSSIAGGGGGFSVRNRRTVSASPLVGRGAATTTLDVDLLHGDTHFANTFDIPSAPAAAEPDPSLPHPSFDLFGPAAFASTQHANTTPLLTTTLTTESLNFLAFVKAAIAEAKDSKETTIEAIASVLDVDQEATEVEDEPIAFEVLLAPETNSKVVAAQGFLHVLTLVSRGLLGVEQERAFGGIEMRVL